MRAILLGKQKRFTFIECSNDLNSMIDVGKIADLVLLMIDASFGFEMVPLRDDVLLLAHLILGNV
jgi:ribosome biogenesis protein BMS1